MWVARAEYEDGTKIEERFPYFEEGNWVIENKRQEQLEEWLITRHEGCIWYSVDYEED